MKQRFSPTNFIEKEISESILDEMFEAARWAASSYNEQPWRFVYAHKGSNSYNKILNSLSEGNRVWASTAPILLFTAVKKIFDRNGKQNRHAYHDLGMAVSNLLNKGVEFGIQAHQMGGFDKDELEGKFGIRSPYEAVACIALGYTDQKEEDKPRTRIDLNELRSQDDWNFA